MRMKVSASGLAFTLILFATSYFGCTLLITPLLLLLPISLSLYRRWADHILYLWFYLPPVSQMLPLSVLSAGHCYRSLPHA